MKMKQDKILIGIELKLSAVAKFTTTAYEQKCLTKSIELLHNLHQFNPQELLKTE